MKILLLFIFLSTSLYSQLNVNVTNIYQDSEYFLNVEATITFNGNPVVPEKDDVLLIEQNYSNNLLSVNSISNNQVNLKFKPVYSVIRDPKTYNGILVVNYNDAIVKRNLELFNLNNPRIIFTKVDGARIETIDFGVANIGQTRIRQAFLRTNGNRSIGGNIVSTRVDSIAVNNPAFNVTWDGQLGGIGNPQPPLGILPSVNYLLTFTFKPESSEPYSAVFTVYYDNGARAELLFTGNNLTIDEDEVEKFFNVLTPNGGEAFAPCLDIPIDWEGNSNGFNTTIDFSQDNGKNWDNLGSSSSGSFLWDIPKVTTDSAKIRISQEFKSLNRTTTPLGTDTIVEVSYSEDDNLIKIFSSNRINLDLNGDFFLGNSVSRSDYFGTGFIEEDKFVVGLRDLNKSSRYDSVLIYSTSQALPIGRFPTKVFPVQSLKTNQKTNKFYILEEYGNKVYEYDENGLLDSIVFNSFISSFSIASDRNFLSAISYSGDLYIYDLENKSFVREIKVDGTPYIINNAISPNGKIVALGAKINDVSQEAAFVFLVDVESGSIFKIFEVAASDPIDLSFNPNSTILVIVSKWSPQILVWDLIGDKAITGFGGTGGEVIAGSFASSQNTLIVSSKKPNELTKFTLVFPLYDESDSTFRIVDPIVSAENININQELIFKLDSAYFLNHVCNDGEVDFILDNFWFNNGKDYNVEFDKFKDTLKPGECSSFKIFFEPQDIGELNDTLNLSNNCTVNLQIPLSGEGLPRNVEYFNSQNNLGTVCINDTINGRIDLIRNLDNAELQITGIEMISSDAIFNYQNISNQILDFNDVLSLDFEASPLFAGQNNIILRVYFNNQSKYYFEINLVIDGIGSTLEASHDYLPFIAEEGNRILTIKNQFDKPIEILGYDFVPNNGYSLVSQLPNEILPGEEINLELSWDGLYKQPVRLIINADPCPLGNNFVLLPYSSTNFIEIPDITAESPASEVSIPIIINDSPNHEYKGNRNFDMAFRLNPRLFFPTSIESKFGNGEILSNSIENDLRKVVVKLNGDFPKQDTLMLVKGVSGIAETDVTSINFVREETTFGESTNLIYNNGSLKINGLHNNRRVIHTYLDDLNIINVSPNPSDGNLNIDVDSNIELEIVVIVRNSVGQEVYKSKNNIIYGINSIKISKVNVSSGQYYIELSDENKIYDSYPITITK